MLVLPEPCEDTEALVLAPAELPVWLESLGTSTWGIVDREGMGSGWWRFALVGCQIREGVFVQPAAKPGVLPTDLRRVPQDRADGLLG